MDSINLAEYLRHGMIFKNLAENELFDAIVYENYENTKVIPPANFHVCKEHGSKLASELLAYHHRFDRLLIILDSTSVTSLLPFLEQLDLGKRVIICNLGTGMSGYITKGKPEIHDIEILQHLLLPMAEPFDFVSLFTLMKSEHNIYIRVSGKEFGGNIFHDQSWPREGWYIDLRKYGLTGSEGTIVVASSFASEAIQIIQALPKKYDWFIQTHFLHTLSDELVESLESTQKLIVIGDYAGTGQIQDWREARLKKHGLGNVSCTMICPYTVPYTNNVQSILLEEIFEQSEFSVEKIAERLL